MQSLLRLLCYAVQVESNILVRVDLGLDFIFAMQSIFIILRLNSQLPANCMSHSMAQTIVLLGTIKTRQETPLNLKNNQESFVSADSICC